MSKVQHKISYRYSSGPFCGILNYLNGKSYRITCSSVYNNEAENSPYNVVDYYDTENSFSSEDEPYSWICFDFLNRSVTLKCYSIRSSPFGENLSHLKSWVIEGSDDNEFWTIIDERNDCSYLNGSNNIISFECQNSLDFRYIRLRQTGENWRNRNYLKLNAIEFFGTLNENF